MSVVGEGRGMHIKKLMGFECIGKEIRCREGRRCTERRCKEGNIGKEMEG